MRLDQFADEETTARKGLLYSKRYDVKQVELSERLANELPSWAKQD